MKKIELHLHLDGSLNIQYASNLIGRDVSNDLVSNNAKTLNEYLEKFDLPIKLLKSSEDIETFTSLLAKDLESEEVIYAEIRFCPLLHVGTLNASQVIDAVLSGLKKVPELKSKLILCMMRNFSDNKNIEIINLAEKYLGKGVVGLDLAGDEAKYNTKNFEGLFNIIKEKKIPFAIHAGEADNYESVDTAIKFGAKRIGHGVRSIENKKTIDSLVANGITLEVCVKSNVDTGIYKNISDHPIKQLIESGILVTINTDNRTVSNTTLEYEYSLLRENFGFKDCDFIKMNINAINASFLSESEKEDLKKELLN